MATTESFYVAVYCNGVTRYAPISEFTASLAKVHAEFASIDIVEGCLVCGPSHGQFAALASYCQTCADDTALAEAAVSDMETRITNIENEYKPKLQEFDNEFSPDFD